MYSYTNLKDHIFDPIVYANISSDYTVRDILNRAVRKLNRDVDLRSTKRKTQVSPGLFEDVYTYPWPSDAKGLGFIDLQPQVNRSRDLEWDLTTPEEFDRRKLYDRGQGRELVAIRESDMVKKLLASLEVDDDSLTISTLDALDAGGGEWEAFGDAENVVADADNYVAGAGSIKFDISSAGGTTAGIKNTDLDEFDFSDYVDNNRSVFVWVYINSTTNLTNFILRIGSSDSAYYSITITTNHEAQAFVAGWNLLRFDFTNKVATGSPDTEVGTYVALYMTKAGAKTDDGYRFDNLVMRGGVIHDLYYYSKYGWQTNTGTYIENSTADTDNLNLDTDEFDLAVLKGKIEASMERKDTTLLADLKAEYKEAIKEYKLKNPSEAKLLTTIYHEL
jgi:hypothetical protein